MKLPALLLFATVAAWLSLDASAAPPNYHNLTKIPVGGDTGWDYLEPDAIARRLYVTHEDHVVVVHMDTLKVVGNVPDCPGMGGVAIAHDLNRGFTANGDDDTVTVFALDSLKPLARWKATGKEPNQIVYDGQSDGVRAFGVR